MPPEEKTMYRVERFLPPSCPHCDVAFAREGDRADYLRFLGDVDADGVRHVRATDGYDIIVCGHCGNYTMRVLLETCQVGDRAVARRLLDEGFVNFQEVRAVGTATRDTHVVHGAKPATRVYAVVCNGGDSGPPALVPGVLDARALRDGMPVQYRRGRSNAARHDVDWESDWLDGRLHVRLRQADLPRSHRGQTPFWRKGDPATIGIAGMTDWAEYDASDLWTATRSSPRTTCWRCGWLNRTRRIRRRLPP